MIAQKGSFLASRAESRTAVKAAGLLGFSLLASAVGCPARATDFTAGTVMAKMDGKERYAFVAGIVEGLAMSRYMKDGKKPEGMKCIYDWFYSGNDTAATVYAAFQRYPDYPPGTVVGVMTKKACGE